MTLYFSDYSKGTFFNPQYSTVSGNSFILLIGIITYMLKVVIVRFFPIQLYAFFGEDLIGYR